MTDKKLIPFLAAMCLFLSTIEYVIPKPLPFLRLGLANLPVILALAKLRTRDIVALMGLKILGQGFVSGTLFSYVFVFSAAGSCASGFAMLAFQRMAGHRGGRPLIGFIGISIAGALANNAAQILLARFFLFGEGTRFIAPALLITGSITGFLLGLFAEKFAALSRWYAALPDVYPIGAKEAAP
ncbi:MAG: Gx transporter family protein [Treponema sp.]|nr:Gx transporter family protein [Treponema sp.]